LAFALDEGHESLASADLERHAEPTRKLLRMAWELKEGEEAMQDRGDGRMELRSLLGLEPQTSNSDWTDELKPRTPDATGRKRAAGRVGQRRPVRDPVGEGQDEH